MDRVKRRHIDKIKVENCLHRGCYDAISIFAPGGNQSIFLFHLRRNLLAKKIFKGGSVD